MTAFSGGSISEESFAISTAILAAPYAALQTDSLEDPSPSSVVSMEIHDGEAMDRAMALDEAASALRSLARGRNVASSCFMYSAMGGVGVDGGVFVGVADGEVLFRK